MKKRNWKIRIPVLLLFLGLSGMVMLSIYSLSSEDGQQSSVRSETVTETIKEEVNTKLNEKGLRLVDKIKYYVILKSPYGSDWNLNIRKLAHFSIYFALGSMVYISFAILGVNKTLRFLLAVFLCFLFAIADEYHQSFTAGRVMAKLDVFIDTAGAFSAASLLTVVSWVFCGIRYGVNKMYDDKKESKVALDSR